MTLNIQKLQLSKVVDPRILVDEGKTFSVLQSATQNTFKTISSSSYSTSSISFSAPPPFGVCTDRCVQLSVPFQIDLIGTSPIGGLLGNAYGNVLAIRQKALQQTILSMTGYINQQSFTLNVADVMEPLIRYNMDSKKQAIFESGSPNFADYYQNYNDAVTFGQNFNPLSSNAIYAYQTGNGAFPVTITNNTSTTARLNFTLTEGLFLPPFIFSNNSDSSGFFNVTRLDFTFNFIANLQRLLQFDGIQTNYTLSSIIVTLPTQPNMTFQYLSPPMTMSIPKMVTYPYTRIGSYVTDVGAMAPAASQSLFTTNVIQLNVIPKKIFVVARRKQADRYSSNGYQYSDTYGYINQISLDFGNLSSQLASATPYQLYAMSARNGVQETWTQWQKFTGSVICIEPGLDFPLEELQSEGALCNITMQVKVSFTNINPSQTINFEVDIMTTQTGVMNLDSELCNVSTGVLTKSDVLEASQLPMQSAYKRYDMWGNGDYWSDIKKGFSEVGDILKTVLPLVTQILPLLALGEGEGEGARRPKKLGGEGDASLGKEMVPYGSGKIGGKVITREELLKRMK